MRTPVEIVDRELQARTDHPVHVVGQAILSELKREGWLNTAKWEVRDDFAALEAECVRLRAELAELEAGREIERMMLRNAAKQFTEGRTMSCSQCESMATAGREKLARVLE